MEPKSASVERIDGAQTVVLREPTTDSVVHIVSDIGSNVARFATGGREVLAAPPDIATLRERPTRWGSACLFPYPGRIKDGRFTFSGQTIQLPTDPRDGNAIHGCVRTRPWRIVATSSDASGASTTTRISTREERIPESEWPFPFELGLTVSLRDGVLRVTTEAANTGAAPMPLGLGFHPYFPAPNDDCTVEIDATEEWGQEAGLPTGRVVQLSDGGRFRRATPLSELSLVGGVRNHLLRKTGGEGIRATLRNPVDGLATHIQASPEFSRMVLFTPESPPLISLEPQTCVPNAFRMANESDLDTGIVSLAPGQRWSGWFEISAEAT